MTNLDQGGRRFSDPVGQLTSAVELALDESDTEKLCFERLLQRDAVNKELNVAILDWWGEHAFRNA